MANKDVKQLIKRCVKITGKEAIFTKNNHYKVPCPNGKYAVTGSTGQGYRAVLEFRAQLLRNGFSRQDLGLMGFMLTDPADETLETIKELSPEAEGLPSAGSLIRLKATEGAIKLGSGDYYSEEEDDLLVVIGWAEDTACDSDADLYLHALCNGDAGWVEAWRSWWSIEIINEAQNAS